MGELVQQIQGDVLFGHHLFSDTTSRDTSKRRRRAELYEQLKPAARLHN